MRAVISKSYGEKQVFDTLDLHINEGETLCVMGASGVGKTTLLTILARQTDFVGELENVPEKVGYVFQEPRLLPALTVWQNMQYVGDGYENTEKLLRLAELWEHRNKRPKALSGGEKQRAALVRAFGVESDLLLLDEPFSSLDIALKNKLYSVFCALMKKCNKTAVLVTHDLQDAWAISDRIIVLKDGKIALDRTLQGEKPRSVSGGERIKEEIYRVLTGESIR